MEPRRLPDSQIVTLSSPLSSPINSSVPEFGVLYDDTRFWVIHRRDCYGPFDYQWSPDLYGVELLYQGEKFGECCSMHQFFADLKPFRLPTRVSEVAITVSGAVVRCLLRSVSRNERMQQVTQVLTESGLGRYQLSMRESA